MSASPCQPGFAQPRFPTSRMHLKWDRGNRRSYRSIQLAWKLAGICISSRVVGMRQKCLALKFSELSLFSIFCPRRCDPSYPDIEKITLNCLSFHSFSNICPCRLNKRLLEGEKKSQHCERNKTLKSIKMKCNKYVEYITLLYNSFN